jgi:hypothetical protein
MKTCDNTGDCRLEYTCVLPADITTSGELDPNLPVDERVARIIDLEAYKAEAKICVALTQESVEPDPPTQTELDGGL